MRLVVRRIRDREVERQCKKSGPAEHFLSLTGTAQCKTRPAVAEHYDNPTPVVAAVVEHNGMVVLAHNRAWPPTIKTLNEELDDIRHVPLHECKVWLAGTGFALRDWLRSKGLEPPVMEIRADPKSQ